MKCRGKKCHESGDEIFATFKQKIELNVTKNKKSECFGNLKPWTTGRKNNHLFILLPQFRKRPNI